MVQKVSTGVEISGSGFGHDSIRIAFLDSFAGEARYSFAYSGICVQSKELNIKPTL